MFEVTKKLVPLAFAVYVLFVPSGIASAVDLTSNQEQVQEFYESMLSKRVLLGEEGSEEALQAYYADQQIADQNKRELSVVAQLIDYFTDDVLGDYYQQWINGYLDIPSGGVSSAVLDDSYGQYTGFYKTSADSQPYSCSFKPSASGLIVSSSHFSLTIRWETVAFETVGRTSETKPYYRWNSNGRYEIGSQIEYSARSGSNASTAYIYRILEGSGYFSSVTGRTQVRSVGSSAGSGSVSCYVQLGVGTGLPVVNSSSMGIYINNNYSQLLASWGSIVKLPEGDLTQEPWEYFNTKFLPWVRGECDALGFDYRLITPYPDGYTPPHDPLEPAPVVPIATRPYSPFYHKATETYTEAVTQTVTQVVTDESGEPVTDNNGDTSVITDTQLVTDQNGDVIYETFIQAVTNSDGDDEYVYEFNIPDLPELKIPDGTLPLNEIDLSDHSAQMGGIWEAINRILTDSGLISIVVPFLAIGLLIYILTKLG